MTQPIGNVAEREALLAVLERCDELIEKAEEWPTKADVAGYMKTQIRGILALEIRAVCIVALTAPWFDLDQKNARGA